MSIRYVEKDVQDNIAVNEMTANHIHLSNDESAGIFIEADVDDVDETDVPYIIFSHDAGDSAMSIAGDNNSFTILSGTNTGLRGFDIKLVDVVSNGPGVAPTLSNPVNMFRIRDGAIHMYADVYLSGGLSMGGDIELNGFVVNS